MDRPPFVPTTLEDTMFLAQITTTAYTMVYVLSPLAVEKYLANPLGWCTNRVTKSQRMPERHRIVTLSIRRYQKDPTFLDRPDTLGGTGNVQD